MPEVLTLADFAMTEQSRLVALLLAFSITMSLHDLDMLETIFVLQGKSSGQD